MSHEATNWAFKQRGLKPSTRVVLLALADCHNPHHGCFPSKKTLAADCELSERAVYEHIKVLESIGLVHVTAVFSRAKGQFSSNRYLLAFEADFPRQILPSADISNGSAPSLPSADFADYRRQILPNNPVIEPRKEEPVMAPAVVPAADKPIKPDKQRLPEDWALSDEGWAYARKQNIPDEVIGDEALGFHAYWTDRTDKDSRKSQRGWEQCWATRCRLIAGRYKPRGVMAGNPAPGRYGQGSSIASIVARRRLDG